MTSAPLKPFLIVLAIGLLAILARPILDLEPGSSWFGITARFEHVVTACLDEHPGWDRRICEGIARGDLWAGMTEEMVRASLGEPRRIERPDDDATVEQWTYYTPYYGLELLRLQDGVLTDYGPPSDACETCGVRRPRP